MLVLAEAKQVMKMLLHRLTDRLWPIVGLLHGPKMPHFMYHLLSLTFHQFSDLVFLPRKKVPNFPRPIHTDQLAAPPTIGAAICLPPIEPRY